MHNIWLYLYLHYQNFVRLIVVSSWQAQRDAARIQSFTSILEHSLKKEKVPDIYYHWRCRSTFSHKKTLRALSADVAQTSQEEPSSSDTKPSNLKIQPSQLRIYEEKCIFCAKTSKYKNGSNTREPLVMLIAFWWHGKVHNIRKDEH